MAGVALRGEKDEDGETERCVSGKRSEGRDHLDRNSAQSTPLARRASRAKPPKNSLESVP